MSIIYQELYAYSQQQISFVFIKQRTLENNLRGAGGRRLVKKEKN